jgi:predicted small lipoprotein YifL
MSLLHRTVLLTLALLLLAGCGYKNTQSGPVALPENKRKLFLEDVENPTLETDLYARIRSLVRDELTRRGQVQWVPRGAAEALMSVDIRTFTSRASVKDAEDETLRSTASITLDAEIVSATDRSVLWTSGEVSASEPFTTGGQEDAEERAILLGVERLVDRLGQNF